MVISRHNQDFGKHSIGLLISECFFENEYSQFREYCASSNIFYIHELQPFDYVAFRTQSNTDVEVVRKIREKVESILSDEKIITPVIDDPKPIAHQSESAKLGNESKNIPWELSLKAAASEYINTPLEGISLPNRVRHRLLSVGITSVGKMLLTTPEQFRVIGFIGEHSLRVIRSISEDIVLKYMNQESIIPVTLPVSNLNQEIKTNNSITEQAVKKHEQPAVLHQQPNYQIIEAKSDPILVAVANECLNVSLDALKLSPRVNHRLQSKGIRTVGMVLLASDEELLGIKQLGIRSVQEIRDASGIFLQEHTSQNPDWQKRIDQHSPDVIRPNDQTYVNTNERITPRVRYFVKELLAVNSQFNENYILLIEERKIIKKVQQAIEIIGKEICQVAYDDPKNTRLLIQGLQSYIEFQDTVDSIQRLISKIQSERRNKQLFPYIDLFAQLNIPAKEALSSYFSNCNKVSDIEDKIYLIAQQEDQRIIKTFLEWLSSFDILDFIRPILTEIVGEGRKNKYFLVEQLEKH